MKPLTATDETTLFPELAVSSDAISMNELMRAVQKFISGEAAGPDELPVEFWKAVIGCGPGKGANWFLDFCNLIWQGRAVPDIWHLQTVSTDFQKRRPAGPQQL